MMSKLASIISICVLATIVTKISFADSALAPPIPYQLIGGHIVIPIRIDGQGPFSAELDDGTQNMLLDASVADKIGLHPTGERDVTSFGQSTVRMFTSTPAAVSVGGAILSSEVMVVSNFHATGLDAGGGVQAIVGYDLFKSYVVTLDREANTVTISDPATFTPPSGSVSIPISIGERGMPLVAASLNGVPGTFQLDLGDTAGVMLYPGFAAKNSEHFSMDNAKHISVPQLGGESEITVLPRGGDIVLGPLKANVTNIVVMANDPPHFGATDLAGNVGVSLWNHLIVTLDLKRERLIVSK